MGEAVIKRHVGFGHIAFLAVLALATPLVIPPAHALVDGPWIEKEPARYRMVAAEVDGTPYAALQIELKPGWHTYWRYPGASGLVPEFDFEGSRNIVVAEPLFPAPYFSTMASAALTAIRRGRFCFPIGYATKRRITYARHDWRVPRGLRANECRAKFGFQSRRAKIITT